MSEILGVLIDAVEVIINEVSKANWGKGGVQVEEPPSSDQKRTRLTRQGPWSAWPKEPVLLELRCGLRMF